MKAGDLVRYIGVGGGDNVTGVIVSITNPASWLPWAEVVWSLRYGPHYDEVPLEDLEIVNESR